MVLVTKMFQGPFFSTPFTSETPFTEVSDVLPSIETFSFSTARIRTYRFELSSIASTL